MKVHLYITLLLPLIAGCSQFGSKQQEEPVAPTHETVLQAPEPYAGSWLQARHRLCLLPEESQETRLRQLERRAQGGSREARIERLLIASCRPEQTASVLRASLAGLSTTPGLAESERQLVQLVRDLDKSNRLLEEENRRLREEMKATIDGLRAIETDIENIQQSKEEP